MLLKLGVPILMLASGLGFASKPADARVQVGIGVGPAWYGSGFYSSYYSPYYPYYGYRSPYYGFPAYGFGWSSGHHHHHHH